MGLKDRDYMKERHQTNKGENKKINTKWQDEINNKFSKECKQEKKHDKYKIIKKYQLFAIAIAIILTILNNQKKDENINIFKEYTKTITSNLNKIYYNKGIFTKPVSESESNDKNTKKWKKYVVCSNKESNCKTTYTQ